jgi:hypothetical protein
MRKLAAFLVAALLLTGCATGRLGPPPLSNRWANEQQQQRDLKARRERIGKPLFGRADNGQEGKLRAVFGGDRGLRTEIEGTSGGSVYYRFNW